MMLLSSLIKAFEADFLDQYQARLLPSHRKALAAMKICRTTQSPKMLAGCCECDHQVLVPHSCGHRICPHCQSHESQRWIEGQLRKQTPAKYFLLTFTLPAEFRSLAWHHQRRVYDLLMTCSWDTLRTFSQNDKRLQGMPGITAVLHTHSRRLDYHPHVHVVMPAGAVNLKQRLWRSKSGKGKRPYLFNHKAVAKVFRAKMLEGLKQAGLTLPAQHPEQWVVDCKPVGTGEKAIIYLGRYLYRGVIREKDILACQDGNVTFRYKESKAGTTQYRTVPGATFLWLLLQHVLPKNFRRARNYGFMHPNSKRLIQFLHYLFKLYPIPILEALSKRPQFICRCCGATMKIIRTRIHPEFEHSFKEEAAATAV